MGAIGVGRSGDRVFRAVNAVILVAVCVATLFPFLNVIAVSLSGRNPVSRGEVSFYPKDFTLQAYKKILQNDAIFRAYGNTLFVVLVGTVLSVGMTAFAAYPLSKRNLVGRNAITFLFALTMWFSAGMIPQFLVVRDLGLFDRLWALIMVPLVSAFHVIIMRTFFQTIPASLEESAKIDGANDAVVLFRIVMPLSKPVLATVALWVAVFHWNTFMDPLIFLQTRSKFTLQLVLRDIILANSAMEYGMDVNPDMSEFEVVSESVKYGTIIVATLPILCLYPFLQKYFVQGVLIGSIKG